MDPALLKLLIFVGLFLILLPLAYWRSRDAEDPEWEDRWQELPLRERTRISAAVRRGGRFEDRDEAYLAAGSARQQHSVAELFSHSHVLRVVIITVVLLAAIAEGSVPMIAVALLALAIFGWFAYRDRATRRNLARARDLDHGTCSAAFALSWAYGRERTNAEMNRWCPASSPGRRAGSGW
jgi:Flp pilus assembly protein TadB